MAHVLMGYGKRPRHAEYLPHDVSQFADRIWWSRRFRLPACASRNDCVSLGSVRQRHAPHFPGRIATPYSSYWHAGQRPCAKGGPYLILNSLCGFASLRERDFCPFDRRFLGAKPKAGLSQSRKDAKEIQNLNFLGRASLGSAGREWRLAGSCVGLKLERRR
jgi:hypothetical protein